MNKAFPVVATGPGVTRQLLADHPDLMVVSFRFEKGAEGRLHDHPHGQSTYDRSEQLRFRIGDREQ